MSNSDSKLKTLQEAEEYKNRGNEEFKNARYEDAIIHYTNAIELEINEKCSAIYYSNRAFCHLRMENYGLVIEDSDKAINIDSQYAKAYYRKAAAYIILNKYEKALECLKFVVFDLKVKDKDTQEKYKFVNKIVKERKFAEAISIPDAIEEINIEDIMVEEQYTGPRINSIKDINSVWVVALMDFLKNQKKLHKKYLAMIIMEAIQLYKKEQTLIYIDIPNETELSICGDTHGQFYDLLNIFQINKNPSQQNPYLFNGDFVDRGSFSVEVIITLLAWKMADPTSMYLTRGNHECKNMTSLYGQQRFQGEVLNKYDQKIYDLFISLFNHLPLVYIINKKVMVCHGGLFCQDGVTLEDIQKINRFKEPPESGLMTDLLWADPIKENGRQPSKRGISTGFGPDVAEKFLKENNLELLVRSHEMKEEGYEVEPNGKVITIFSAPNYCDQMKNKGALIRFQGQTMKPKFTQFEAVDHPKIPPMAYAKAYPGLFGFS